mgnify:CR=1 FL=1
MWVCLIRQSKNLGNGTGCTEKFGTDLSDDQDYCKSGSADLKKDGSGLDLPIAVGILVSSGVLQQEQVDDTIFVGELALDGTIRQIAGVLPMILHARDIGRKNIVIPAGNCAEGRLVDGIDVLIPASLLDW